jgi:hypothetical protein
MSTTTNTTIRRITTAAVGTVFGLSLMTGIAGATSNGNGNGNDGTNASSSASKTCDGGFNSDSGNGANTDGPNNQYHNTCNADGTSSPSGNGNGNGQSDNSSKPCAGCVGNADDKNPPGQAPNGSDHNNGYECDGNHGVGRTNPAHTGCQTATPPPDDNPGDNPGDGDHGGGNGDGDGDHSACPNADAMLTSHHYEVNGLEVADLTGHVKPGDTVKAFFTIAAGCTNKQLSLASYPASGHVFDSATGTFGPGGHTLTVSVPTCAFIVDFVHGGVINQLGSAGYGDRMIDTDSGSVSCPAAATNPGDNPTGGPGSSPAANNGVNIEAASFGPSTPASVLGEHVSLETPAAAGRPTQVLGEQVTRTAATGPLALTGSSSLVDLSGIGASLLAIGMSIVWMRRKSADDQFVSVSERLAAF